MYSFTFNQEQAVPFFYNTPPPSEATNWDILNYPYNSKPISDYQIKTYHYLNAMATSNPLQRKKYFSHMMTNYN